jgi:formylglycine-generating enzyme required for sulfatase activity
MRLPSEKEWELAVHENILNLIDPNTLNDAIDFFEWTSSAYYDPELPEWIDISVDPPDALTLRGGQLNVNEPFKAYMTKRASAIPSHSAYIIGFRCAIEN